MRSACDRSVFPAKHTNPESEIPPLNLAACCGSLHGVLAPGAVAEGSSGCLG